MLDLILCGVALVVLVGAVVVLVRADRRGPGLTAGLIAVIVLAAGTFAVALYRSRSEPVRVTTTVTIQASAAAPTPETARVDVPMGTGDKLPQGALTLDPPQPGPDAYTGDVSLLCYTPDKEETEQNCTGDDQRIWTIEPLGERAVLAPAEGDPFADPKACDVPLAAKYVQLEEGASYCVRDARGTGPIVALRIPSFPAERPLPASLGVQVAVLSR